jgi:hypothetical protein
MGDYLTLNRLGFQLIIETEHGDAETHRALVDQTMVFLASEAFPGPL